jgi:hypothetical protein
VILTLTGADSPNNGLFQLSVDVDQVAKFGGVPLFFANLSQKIWESEIVLALNPDVHAGSFLYFTFYEAVRVRSVTFSAVWAGRSAIPKTRAKSASFVASVPSMEMKTATEQQTSTNFVASVPSTEMKTTTEQQTSALQIRNQEIASGESHFDWGIIPVAILSGVVYIGLLYAARKCSIWLRLRFDENPGAPVLDDPNRDIRLPDETARPIM